MPVFQETSHESRDIRILRSRELPLPRLTPRPILSGGSDTKHEVVVIGSGPAGMMLTLLLARYGLGKSLVCYESKPETLKAGQADGLQPRTLEVLKSLDLADEVINHGCHMSEVAFWNPKGGNSSGKGSGIERTSFAPDVAVAARYKHEVTIHQGRIERILEDNLNQYSTNCIQRSTKFIDFQLDAIGDAEYPLKIELEQETVGGDKIRKTVRSKYLIGADGAHSQVRRSMGLELTGETTDHIWGVVDFVVDTDFPDVRKRCAIHSDFGSVMIIPRERISSGQYLTRLYVQIKDEVPVGESDPSDPVSRMKSRGRRAAITLDFIMKQAQRVFSPYSLSVKNGTEVDWWAAYQIGQRMTSKFSMSDEVGWERVFIVGDGQSRFEMHFTLADLQKACHTHSPKAGQGMNISMMDSYNLAWKLAYTIHGLSPQQSTASVLATYESERLQIARMLIEFDTKFSSMFSGQITLDSSVQGLTHEQFLRVFSDGSGFTSGCGIEYSQSILVQIPSMENPNPITGDDYLHGTLKPGRRLLDSVVRRYADANLRHLQDDFPSTGRFRILVFATPDLLNSDGISSQALSKICNDIIPSFPADTVELVVLHPFMKRAFEWNEIPNYVKDAAEMKFHGPVDDHLYGIYGVDRDMGALVVIRPDGYVGIVSHLTNSSHVDTYLTQSLVKII